MTTQISGTTGVSQVQDNSVTPSKLTQKLTLATAQNSTSGTSIDFTGIPSWVKRITVMFDGVSTNGTSVIQVQLGTSGSVITAGYDTNACGINNAGAIGTTAADFTAGFALTSTNTAASQYLGNIILNNMGNNTWVSSGVLLNNSAGAVMINSGKKALGTVLDRIRITTVNGTDTFDAGSINIMYEG